MKWFTEVLLRTISACIPAMLCSGIAAWWLEGTPYAKLAAVIVFWVVFAEIMIITHIQDVKDMLQGKGKP